MAKEQFNPDPVNAAGDPYVGVHGTPTDGQVPTWNAANDRAEWADQTGGGVVTAIDSARVDTDQSTSSTTYTNLTTSGPAVTLTTGTSVIVIASANIYRVSGSGNTGFIGVEVSGASTIAATDVNGASCVGINSGFPVSASKAFKITGLTAGSNTFTMKYRVDGSTFSYYYRTLVVIAI